MDKLIFAETMPGRLATTPEGQPSFVPNPLPPEIEPSWRLMQSVSRADRAVAKLAGIGRTLPNPHLLIRPFLRREAILSSRIEGTHATLNDLLLFESERSNESADSDVREVANYVRALDYGLERLHDLPLSLRFIREVHRQLMEGVRGGSSRPGEFREQQNWIGSARIEQASYIPSPIPEMNAALDAFEKYLHAESHLPTLIRCALIHYQFEAIHPFLDGNGRVGRLLIMFLLHLEGILTQPLLYLSAYFEKRRDAYMRHLFEVSRAGAWSEWIEFFLTGVEEQATDAVQRANVLLELAKTYRQRVATARSSALLVAVVDQLFETPATTITGVARRFNISYPAAKNNVDKLLQLRILEEPPESGRNRVYRAPEIIRIIDEN